MIDLQHRHLEHRHGQAWSLPQARLETWMACDGVDMQKAAALTLPPNGCRDMFQYHRTSRNFDLSNKDAILDCSCASRQPEAAECLVRATS